MKIFIIVDSGTVTGVYSDAKGVECEIIDLDDVNDEKESALAEARAEEVMGEYVEVG